MADDPCWAGYEQAGTKEKDGKTVPNCIPKADDTTANKVIGAGILFISQGRVLLIQRGPDGDSPGTWAFPGGHVEPGETLEGAARRECQEEMGVMPEGTPKPYDQTDDGAVQFTTFIQSCAPFNPTLNDESTGFVWAPLDQWPAPLHPGAAATLAKLTMNEMDVATGIRDGWFPSPSRFQNVTMFAMRITGTGVAFRTSKSQFTLRPPEHYLTPEFLARCNGLPVICEHPELATLNSAEFAGRIIGTVLLPYISGNEVWGIAKIYDDDAIQMLRDNQLSTSPTVVVSHPEVDSIVALDDGNSLLIEGKPCLLDHLAICPHGVWDKGGAPSGVINQAAKEPAVTEEEKKAAEAAAAAKKDADEKAKADKAKADAESDRWSKMDKFMDSVTSGLSSMSARMDSYEKSKADSKKADADVEGGLDLTKVETTPAMVAASKADAKAKADAEEEEEKRKKVDADTRQQIEDLKARMPREMSDSERGEMADAQAKADSVAQAFGDSAPRPAHGESALDYRRRVLGSFKKHSPTWKDVDISKVADPAMLGPIEQTVYADAIRVANNPASAPAGQLREVVRTDSTGRRISTFVGQPSAWMNDFKLQPRRARFNSNLARGNSAMGA